MYERSYGSKYDPKAPYRTAADIAKDMRADIKAALAKGDLPGTMRNYTVRVQNYSGGRSIDVSAVDLPGMWTKGMDWRDEREIDVLTAEGESVKRVLKMIHNAYNYDGSDVMVDYFDVNYYGQAGVLDPWGQDYRDRQRAKKEAAKATQQAL